MFISRFPGPADVSASSDTDDARDPHEAPGLTTEPSATLPPVGHPLPAQIRIDIAAGHHSAVRAWRSHRGLSWHDVASDSNLNASTLRAIDCGFVDLCEWTVAPIARALGVDAGQLLLAQRLARHAADDDHDGDFPSGRKPR